MASTLSVFAVLLVVLLTAQGGACAASRLLNAHPSTIPSDDSDAQVTFSGYSQNDPSKVAAQFCSGTSGPLCAIKISDTTVCYGFYVVMNVTTSSVPGTCTALSLVSKKNGATYGSTALALNAGTNFASGVVMGPIAHFALNDVVTLWFSAVGSSGSCAGSVITFKQWQGIYSPDFEFFATQGQCARRDASGAETAARSPLAGSGPIPAA